MKLPGNRPGLPGKVISFDIVPLDPAYPAKAGRGTFRSNLKNKKLEYFSFDLALGFWISFDIYSPLVHHFV